MFVLRQGRRLTYSMENFLDMGLTSSKAGELGFPSVTIRRSLCEVLMRSNF